MFPKLPHRRQHARNHDSRCRVKLLLMSGLKQIVFCAIVLLVLSVSIKTTEASPRHPIPTSVCEVLSHSAEWDNKLISVSASYFDGGWPGGPVIADDRCEAGVVDVAFAGTNAEKRLNSAIPDDTLGTFDHSVQATWIGNFRANHGKFHETFLDVQRITNLTVTPVDFLKSDASPISATIEDGRNPSSSLQPQNDSIPLSIRERWNARLHGL